jgi:iron complex outermembrane receptor protein
MPVSALRSGKKKNQIMAAAALISLSCATLSVVAQEESAPPDETRPIEEIIVTGLKRTQSLRDIPSAVSVIGYEELQNRGIKDMYGIQFATPSLHYSEYLGGADITIRGIGDFFGNPGVSVATDNVYQPTGLTAKLSQMDIERVEILRGPQGTLYGRNSNGGVVNLVSVAPTFESEGYLSVGYAEFDEYKLAGAYGGPLTERTAFRIAIDYTDRNDGWIENFDPEEDDLMFGESASVRLRTTTQLTDDFELNLIYSRNSQEGSLNHSAFFTDNRDLADPLITASDITLEPLKTFSAIDDDYDINYEHFSIDIAWDLPFGTLNSISAYQDYEEVRIHDSGATSDLIIIQQEDTSQETYTQELRLSNSTAAIDWIIGLYYMDINSESLSPFTFPLGLQGQGLPPGSMLTFDTGKYDTESRALFADATWKVTDKASLSFGARHTKDEISMTSLQTIFIPAFGLTIVNCDVSRDVDDSSTTIRASGKYDISLKGNVYMSYSEGFKAGGVAYYECNPPYDPEKVDAYEIGTKWTLFSGTTTVNATLFHYDYQDFQVQQVIGLGTVVRNAGDATIDGFELETWSNLNEHWSINVGLTLLDSEYEDFINLDGIQPELGFQQLKGNPLNATPDISANLGVVYSTQLSGGSSLKLRADIAYRSRTYFREFKEKLDSQEAYTIVNLNASWESSDGAWTGRLYANNATDEEYIQFLTGAATNGGRLGSWAMPGQLGAELTRRF